MDVYQIVTDNLVSLLEAGTVPWKKPWATSNGMPKNLVSNKEYRWINTLLLGYQEYSSPYWLTYKQATEKHGFIRKGEKSSLVIFYKMLDKREDDESEKNGKIPMLRYYNLFNLEQCEGIPSPPTEVPTYQFTAIERAESIIKKMPNRPDISYGGNRASYSPVTDSIRIPLEDRFEKSEELYSVLYHELAHSTGHQSRLARKEVMEVNRFGSEPYASEELVGELTSSMLCGVAGISNETIDLAASYLDGWLSVLKKDKKMIVTAAALAQKAADYILNVTHNEALSVDSGS
jgi:antirestriction protein ArdC